jgi:predicted aminopeptidase
MRRSEIKSATLRFASGATLACCIAGCQHALPFYLAEQGFKQGALHLRARSIEDVLADPLTEPRVRSHLETVREARLFAERELGMNPKGAYARYVALDRDWVVQAVTAAHRDRLEASLFKYPFFGALPYRGYFDENDARDYASRLEGMGLDVSVRPVQAYSTTGWLADPVYSSMFAAPGAPPLDGEARLAELIFHELTHTQFYFAGQADFNEAFASWFGYRGALDFVAASQSLAARREELRAELTARHERQLRLAQIVGDVLAEGNAFYAKPGAVARRAEYFASVSARFAREKGFERLATKAWNNAELVGLATYYRLVPRIDAYARAQALSPRAFLARVVERGVAIIPEIIGD